MRHRLPASAAWGINTGIRAVQLGKGKWRPADPEAAQAIIDGHVREIFGPAIKRAKLRFGGPAADDIAGVLIGRNSR